MKEQGAGLPPGKVRGAAHDPFASEEPMDFRVLAVDDEADFIETLVKRFTFRKIPVTAARNGPEALAALEKAPYDVVILDMIGLVDGRVPKGDDGVALILVHRAAFLQDDVGHESKLQRNRKRQKSISRSH